MRNIIIIMSIILFVLSALIFISASSLPDREVSNRHAPVVVASAEPSPMVKDMLGDFAREQAANRALVEQLQSTISTLEDKISSKEQESQAKSMAEVPEEKSRMLAVLGAGSFSSGQVLINDELTSTVSALIPEILASPDHRVVIEGHTDNIPINISTGKRYRDNMELSFLRAKAVALILEKNGIPLDRISITGYGDIHPVASNDTEEGRIENRRVEVRLVP